MQAFGWPSEQLRHFKIMFPSVTVGQAILKTPNAAISQGIAVQVWCYMGPSSAGLAAVLHLLCMLDS